MMMMMVISIIIIIIMAVIVSKSDYPRYHLRAVDYFFKTADEVNDIKRGNTKQQQKEPET